VAVDPGGAHHAGFAPGHRALHAGDADAVSRGKRRGTGRAPSRRTHPVRSFSHKGGGRSPSYSPQRRARCRTPRAQRKLAIGAALPDFQLTDQNGRTVHDRRSARQSSGHRFHLYTLPAARCVPAPFRQLRPVAAPVSRSRRRESCAAFRDCGSGLRYAGGSGRLRTPLGRRTGMAASSPGTWLPLASALGEIYWADEGSIGHNSTTSIFGRDGRLAACKSKAPTIAQINWRI
jgi:hypothetical protein